MITRQKSKCANKQTNKTGEEEEEEEEAEEAECGSRRRHDHVGTHACQLRVAASAHIGAFLI